MGEGSTPGEGERRNELEGDAGGERDENEEVEGEIGKGTVNVDGDVNVDLDKKDVPFLEEAVAIEGVGHFNNEEKTDEISNRIYNFFDKF